MLTQHTYLSAPVCLKFRLAIAENSINVRFNTQDEPRMKNIEMAIYGTENNSTAWINMHAFLMNNDWDTTFIGQYNNTSYEEQQAVLTYVSDPGPYQNIKNLFEPDSDLHSYNGDGVNGLMTHYNICSYLNNLVLMQSAYNKARMLAYSKEQAKEALSPDWRVEVYRNINNLSAEMQGDLITPHAIVTATSVASTTKDREIYSFRKVKFIIDAGSDAVPLFDIITDEQLRSYIVQSEQEHFLGVRPIFITLQHQPEPDGQQIEYKSQRTRVAGGLTAVSSPKGCHR